MKQFDPMLAQDTDKAEQLKRGIWWKGYEPRFKWFCIHKWECVSLFATRKCTKCGKEDVSCPW